MRQLHCLRVQAGSALLEGLISIFLFSIGVVSVMGLQGVMLRDTADSRFRVDAAFLADQLVGRMWADVAHLSSYSADDSVTTYEPLADWIEQAQTQLPNAKIDVTVTGNNVSIDMRWQAGNATAHRYQLDTAVIAGGG